MAKSDVLGRIDCPACGAADGVRVTQDRNGDPFGFCDASCGLQLRIGGNAGRVRQFVERHPWAGTVTDTVTLPLPGVPAKPVEAVREPEPEAPAVPPPKKGTGNALLDFVQGVR